MRISDWSSDVCSSDLLTLGAFVRDIGVDEPPAAPAIGDCWIIGAAPVGAWAGQAHAIAGWTAGGWRFVAPVDGLCAWVETAGVPARFLSGAWHVGDVAATRIMIGGVQVVGAQGRSEEHTSELQSLMRISYAVFCLKKKNTTTIHRKHTQSITK